MTTIAYSTKTRVMAADSRAYSGGATPMGTKRKLHRMVDGSILGISTTTPGLAEALVSWMNQWIAAGLMFQQGGAVDQSAALQAPDLPEELTLSMLWVHPDGEVFMAVDSLLFAGPLEGEFFAVGSGDHYALGAMQVGARPKGAVLAAIALDVWSGGPVRELALDCEMEAAA